MSNNIVVFVCGRNCSAFVEDCIRSIYCQTYTNFKCIFVDDASSDGTAQLVRQVGKPLGNKLTVISNKSRLGKMHNFVEYLHVEDEDVVVIVDADDHLATIYALATINMAYEKYGCWLTYGKMVWSQAGSVDGGEYPLKVRECKLYREYAWLCVHPFTFKGFLWKNIKHDAFLDKKGKYLTSACDQARAYPMLEMCPADKIYAMPYVLYSYNDKNPQSLMYTEKEKQRQNELFVRNKSKYSELIRESSISDSKA